MKVFPFDARQPCLIRPRLRNKQGASAIGLCWWLRISRSWIVVEKAGRLQKLPSNPAALFNVWRLRSNLQNRKILLLMQMKSTFVIKQTRMVSLWNWVGKNFYDPSLKYSKVKVTLSNSLWEWCILPSMAWNWDQSPLMISGMNHQRHQNIIPRSNPPLL